MTMLEQNPGVFWLFITVGLFCFKHFLADFVLQNDWMARGKEAKKGWLLPLVAHTGIHATITGLIFAFMAPGLALAAMAGDWIVHAAIDRIKSILTRHLNSRPDRKSFWWLLGADQLAHQLTHLILSVVAISAL